MAVYRLTDAAEADIVDILEWSESNFGEAARRRYERLIVTALTDIAADPNRLGSVSQPELGVGVRIWHLRGSRERARGPDGFVQRPRHFIIYRPVDGAVLVVGRVLYDTMEINRHRNPGIWD